MSALSVPVLLTEMRLSERRFAELGTRKDEDRKLSHEEDIRDKIRTAGLRVTPPRVAVLGLLRRAKRALSCAEVVEELGEKEWDPATLFRNLVKLEEKGLAQVTSRIGGVARYEAALPGDEPHVHPHFACRDCGIVSCIKGASLRLPPEPHWQRALQDADLQLVGRCPSCRGETKRARRKA